MATKNTEPPRMDLIEQTKKAFEGRGGWAGEILKKMNLVHVEAGKINFEFTVDDTMVNLANQLHVSRSFWVN